MSAGIEQAVLNVLLPGQHADRAVAQGGDPAGADRLEVLLDAGPGDQAAVAR